MVEIVLGVSALAVVTFLLVKSLPTTTERAERNYTPVKHEWASRIDWEAAERIEVDPERRYRKRRSRQLDEAYRPYIEAQRWTLDNVQPPRFAPYGAAFAAAISSIPAPSPACDTSSSASVDCGSF